MSYHTTHVMHSAETVGDHTQYGNKLMYCSTFRTLLTMKFRIENVTFTGHNVIN